MVKEKLPFGLSEAEIKRRGYSIEELRREERRMQGAKKRKETIEQRKKEKAVSEPVKKFETEYTLEDLERAREELKMWQEKFADFGGNNPSKFQSEIRAAASRKNIIEDELEEAGLLNKDKNKK